ncbi:MAG: hypothetical protein ABIS12_00260 [Bacteroidia bacterium]
MSCFRKGFLNGKPFLFFSAGSAANSTFTSSISYHNALTLPNGQTLLFEYNESFIRDDMKSSWMMWPICSKKAAAFSIRSMVMRTVKEVRHITLLFLRKGLLSSIIIS